MWRRKLKSGKRRNWTVMFIPSCAGFFMLAQEYLCLACFQTILTWCNVDVRLTWLLLKIGTQSAQPSQFLGDKIRPKVLNQIIEHCHCNCGFYFSLHHQIWSFASSQVFTIIYLNKNKINQIKSNPETISSSGLKSGKNIRLHCINAYNSSYTLNIIS